jgi:dephospho-CoA kinase
MHKLGLTGGIGSGKTTLAGVFAKLGARVIDADAISRSVTAPGGVAIEPIANAFGSCAITADGALDREWMRNLVFNDKTAKLILEHIVHPLVAKEIAFHTRLALADNVRCLVFDIPLLVESGHWRRTLDRILVVDCRVTTQIERVAHRGGLTQNEVEKIIATQSSRLQRRQAADLVIFNEGKSLNEIGEELAWMGAQFGLSSHPLENCA